MGRRSALGRPTVGGWSQRPGQRHQRRRQASSSQPATSTAALTGAALGYAGKALSTAADALLGRLGTSVLRGDTTTSADTTPVARPAPLTDTVPPAGDATLLADTTAADTATT